MAAQTDLWGEIVPAVERSPVAILREQAALLGTKTKNLVEATVDTAARSGAFVHKFNLVVPSLDDYVYELFRVRHGINQYPLTIDSSEGDEIETEQEFVEWLRHKLSSEGTKKIIGNLLAQVTS